MRQPAAIENKFLVLFHQQLPPQYLFFTQGWRLEKWLHLSEKELTIIEKTLWQVIKKRIEQFDWGQLVSLNFKGARFYRAGWEYIVFRRHDLVIKIPNSLFPEVNSRRYLEETKKIYTTLRKYLPEFIPPTTFRRQKVKGRWLNIIQQPFINGKSYGTKPIKISRLSPLHRQKLKRLFKGLEKVLQKYQWLPDLHLDATPHQDQQREVVLYNLIFTSDHLFLIDFTAYYDPFRLYPQRTHEEIVKHQKLLASLIRLF